MALGDFWTTLNYYGRENVQKVVFIVVNAEKEMSDQWYLSEKPPSFKVMFESYFQVSISCANHETIMLLRDSFGQRTREVQKSRCGNGEVSMEPGG